MDSYRANGDFPFDDQEPPTVHDLQLPFQSPGAIALLMNRVEYVDLFDGVKEGKIVHAFISSVQAREEFFDNDIRSLRDYLAANTMLYLLLILAAPTMDALQDYINDTLPDEKSITAAIGIDKQMFSSLVSEFLIDFKSACDENMRDVETRKAYFYDVMFFYSYIYDNLLKEARSAMGLVHPTTGRDVIHFPDTIGYTPAGITRTVRMRVLLLSYFVSADEIRECMHRRWYPKLYPWQKSRRNTRITFDEWQEFSKYLPEKQSNELSLKHPARQFYDLIYNLSDDVIHGHVAAPNRKIVSHSLDELICQAIVFQFHNWEEIWGLSLWRRDPEMMKRLLHLKKNVMYTVTAEQWVDFMFTD